MSRDASKEVRRALTALIDGQIAVDETVWPLFFGKEEGNKKRYILYGISDENSDEDTFDMYVSSMTVWFDVIEIMDSTAKSENVDDVSDGIRHLINPEKNVKGFSLNDPFNLVMCEFASSGETEVNDENGKYKIRKRTNFRTIVSQ